MMEKKIICLVGPTAVGKTEVALKLAKRIGAEIVSCDSMQIYKGVDIATSKPTLTQTRRIPYHLINILSPTQEFNAALFCARAQKIIAQIHRRGKVPLIVGGTGLYLRALLDGLFSGPGQNVHLREKFTQQAKRYGAGYLYKRLKRVDAKTTGIIHPHDLRRIIRALEVYEQTGRPISALKENTSGIRNRYDVRIFGLTRERLKLYARIEQRVDKMFRRGLVAEISRMPKGKPSKTAKSLLGYKEIKGFLNGEYSSAQAKWLLKRNTRRYAKRQISWFKHEKGVEWIEVGPMDSAESIAERISSLLG